MRLVSTTDRTIRKLNPYMYIPPYNPAERNKLIMSRSFHVHCNKVQVFELSLTIISSSCLRLAASSSDSVSEDDEVKSDESESESESDESLYT